MSKTKPVENKFDRWFRATFGHHPRDYKSYTEIEIELKYTRTRVSNLEKMLKDKAKCADQWNAANAGMNFDEDKKYL